MSWQQGWLINIILSVNDKQEWRINLIPFLITLAKGRALSVLSASMTDKLQPLHIKVYTAVNSNFRKGAHPTDFR